MFKPLSDFNVEAKFEAETPASSSVSSKLPVILLQKSSHTPSDNILDSRVLYTRLSSTSAAQILLQAPRLDGYRLFVEGVNQVQLCNHVPTIV